MNIEDIIEDLRKEISKWPEDDQTAFYLTGYNEDALIRHHHGLGMWIRNHYKLWEVPWEPELRDGVDYSPYHPDQVSFTIIQEVWKRGPML